MPFQIVPGGVRPAIRLTPRASRDGLDGVKRDETGKPVLALRVKAPPVEGAANAALLALLAKSLKLRRSDIRILSGETARTKTVLLMGAGAELDAALRTWIAAAQTNGLPTANFSGTSRLK
ncbi:MAG: DUF167 domain-containing protein [Methylobacterium mesophilicum]|nr:DUF167 domain-containing protein [Methylobacterium mesophilicum]